jgi:hypothetical protein
LFDLESEELKPGTRLAEQFSLAAKIDWKESFTDTVEVKNG